MFFIGMTGDLNRSLNNVGLFVVKALLTVFVQQLVFLRLVSIYLSNN